MNISPIYCPDSGCFWSAHGIPDQYTEARDWHLAAHRAEEHGEPLAEEQVAYAARTGHVIPSTARTTAAAVAAVDALPVGDQPQPLTDAQIAEVQSLDLLAMMPDKSAAIVSGHLAALLAEVKHLRGQQALDDAEYEKATAEIQRLKDQLTARDERLETVRSLCDAADHAGIASGGWFTVEAVRKAASIPATPTAEEAS